MKKGFSNIFTFHLLPLFIVSIFIWFSLVLFDVFFPIKTQSISGHRSIFRASQANFDSGNQAEIELAGSLQDSNSLTLMGSSEFQGFTYSSYFFIPDSLQIPTVGFGHAFHQNFAIYCELLAMQKHLKKSKICIFLSPGWFETEGTNIEAFLEFVRPHFLSSIIQNNQIPLSDKLEIGRYISSKINEIEKPNVNLLYLKDLYGHQQIPFFNKLLQRKYPIENVEYSVKSTSSKKINSTPKKINWNATKTRLQQTFLSSIKSNSIYVSDEYYTTYLIDKKGVYTPGTVNPVNIESNREFKDFLLLVDLLKRNECEASFVMQPLHVYHYQHLEKFNVILDSINSVLEKNKFPFFNLFVTNKKDYEPGTLNDIMHLGDYGWMRINQFLTTTYTFKK